MYRLINKSFDKYLQNVLENHWTVIPASLCSTTPQRRRLLRSVVLRWSLAASRNEFTKCQGQLSTYPVWWRVAFFIFVIPLNSSRDDLTASSCITSNVRLKYLIVQNESCEQQFPLMLKTHLCEGKNIFIPCQIFLKLGANRISGVWMHHS